MKQTIKIPAYPSELFAVKSVLVENNTLYIRGSRYNEDYNIGMWHDTTDFVFTCNGVDVLAGFLGIRMDDWADYIQYILRGHVDILEQYCRKHGLECTLNSNL